MIQQTTPGPQSRPTEHFSGAWFKIVNWGKSEGVECRVRAEEHLGWRLWGDGELKPASLLVITYSGLMPGRGSELASSWRAIIGAQPAILINFMGNRQSAACSDLTFYPSKTCNTAQTPAYIPRARLSYRLAKSNQASSPLGRRRALTTASCAAATAAQAPLSLFGVLISGPFPANRRPSYCQSPWPAPFQRLRGRTASR